MMSFLELLILPWTQLHPVTARPAVEQMEGCGLRWSRTLRDRDLQRLMR